MTTVRMKRWALGLTVGILAIFAGCVTNRLTGTCADDATCAQSLDGGFDASAEGGQTLNCPAKCLGGPCTNDQCDPVRLAAFSEANGLAIDQGGAVVTTDDVDGGPLGGVFYVPFGADGGVVTISEGESYGPATDGRFICWQSSFGTRCAAHNGGLVQPSRFGCSSSYTMVIRDNLVYWTDRGNGIVVAISVNGGSPMAVTDTIAGPVGPPRGYSLAFDGNRFLWIAWGSHIPLGLFGTPTDGGRSPERVSSFQNESVVADVAILVGRDFYYLFLQTGIYRVAKDAPAVATLFAAASVDRTFAAIDERYLYYTSGPIDRPLKNALYRFAIDASIPDNGYLRPGTDGGPEAFVTGQPAPRGICVDDQFVYWINRDPNGGLMRIAKPNE